MKRYYLSKTWREQGPEQYGYLEEDYFSRRKYKILKNEQVLWCFTNSRDAKVAGRIVYERSEKCKGVRSKKAFYSELDGEPQQGLRRGMICLTKK